MSWVLTDGNKPAIMSMSLGGPGQSMAYKQAVDEAVGAGVTVVVAAGNENDNANKYSPAFVPNAITVGATTPRDGRASFSNYGESLDIFAPGYQIESASHSNNRKSATMSGTSMACPHVAGAMAVYLSNNKDMVSSTGAYSTSALR